MTTVAVDFNHRGTAHCIIAHARRSEGPLKLGMTILAIDEDEGMSVEAEVIQMYPNGRIYLQPDNDTWTTP